MNNIESFKVLVINPGSTSTKVSFFIDERETISKNIIISMDIASSKNVWEQYELRENSIQEFLNNELKDIETFDAIAGRGGLIRPVAGGTYLVNKKMLTDAKKNLQGEHVSNLGCALAYYLAKKYNCKSYIIDPVSVDEFEKLAYYSGHPEIKRKTLSHALNIHAAAHHIAKELHKSISETNFIVAHLGGGISIASVKGGKIIDVNDASSDGPFSPERSGGLPLQPFMKICLSGKYSPDEIKKMIMGKGGLFAYLGTNNAKEVEERITKGDSYAKEIYEAMAYQISKEIGAMSTVLKGKIDAIILTGGLANSKMLIDWIKERASFIANVIIVPGENEMLALARGVLRVLRGEEEVKEY